MNARVRDMVYCRLVGFTVVELLIVLVIAMILLLIGVPSFDALIKNQKITTVAHDFFMAINLTRAEAVRRGSRVDLVPSDGVEWSNGWTIFIDLNNNQFPDSGEEVIFSHEKLSNDLKLKAALTDSSKQYLAYNGMGRTRTNSSSQSPQFGTISFTLDKKIRRIKLNFVGRPRICNPEIDHTCTGSADSN
jgi:type IV fimbrial biogenesis protein FimT